MSTLRIVVRRLLAEPGFTAIAALTLSIGIGANLAVFTVVNTILLRPLPVPDSERLVILGHVAPGLPQLNSLPMSPALYFLYSNDSRTLDGVSLVRDQQVNFTGPDNPQRVDAARVTASFFDVVRTPPQLGRTFQGEDERSDAPAVVLLTDGLWQDRFGRDPDVVGRIVEIDGRSTEIIGVMPSDFGFPDSDTRLWLAIRLNPAEAPLGQFGSMGVVRIADGRTLDQVQAELAGMAANLVELFPDQSAAPVLVNAGFAPHVREAREVFVGDIRTTLWMLLGAVGSCCCLRAPTSPIFSWPVQKSGIASWPFAWRWARAEPGSWRRPWARVQPWALSAASPRSPLPGSVCACWSVSVREICPVSTKCRLISPFSASD
jgi:hypothetical protein